MCFDVQSSLLAWSFMYSISIYLYFRDRNYDRWNAGFIMTLATIQLLEAGLWTSINRDKRGFNDILTKLVLLTLMSQPLVQSYLGYKYVSAEKRASEISSSILAMMSWVFLGLLIWALFRVGSAKSGQFFTSVGPNGHLVWSDSQSSSFIGGTWVAILYLAGLFIPLLFMKEWKGISLIAIGIVTAVISILASSKGEFSSYWCYTTVIYSLIALFI